MVTALRFWLLADEQASKVVLRYVDSVGSNSSICVY